MHLDAEIFRVWTFNFLYADARTQTHVDERRCTQTHVDADARTRTNADVSKIFQLDSSFQAVTCLGLEPLSPPILVPCW